MASGDNEELGPSVFDAASDGDIQRLRSLLRFKRACKIRGALSWRDSIDRTSLMVAAHTGHTDMVRVLVEEYGTNVEESKFKDYTKEEITPLVYAANVGHHKTVEVLLKNGARVDHAFPLHRACFASSAGNLECVKLLIAHGADVNRKYRSNSQEDGEMIDGSTPLAVASEQMCTSIVEYLLSKDADPNIPDKHGNRPMHSAFRAIWNQHSELRCRGGCIKDGERIITMLVQHKARQIRNAMDLTPVMIGALTGNLLVVYNSMGTMFNLSPDETIEALQLMASHFFLKERHQIGLETLAKALALLRNRPKTAPDVVHVRVSPYGDFKEPVTLEDLDSIRSNGTYLQVISLMMRERLLSKGAQKYYLWQAIRDFVDRCRPTPEGKSLALRAIRHETDLEVESGFFCGFAVESMMRLLDPNLVSLADSNLEEIVVLLKLAAINLSPDVSELTPESRKEAVQYHRFKSANILHLLALYTNHRHLSPEDKDLLFTLVQQFVMAYNMTIDVMQYLHDAEQAKDPEGALLVRKSAGLPVFHMYYPVVARRRPTDEQNIKERLVTMLLKSGADPCQVDIEGYNALHFLVKRCPSLNQTETFRKNIVVPLAEWGCPILKRNSVTGRSVIEDCSNQDTKQLLMDLALPSLLNLCGRVIRKNKIPYRKSVPVTVAAALDMDV